MTTSAVKAYHTVLPPKASGKQKVQSSACSTTADSIPLFTGLDAASQPTGWVEVSFEAVVADVYLRILAADAASPNVTSSTGMVVRGGQPALSYWLNSDTDTHVEFVGSATGTLKWYVSSPDFEV